MNEFKYNLNQPEYRIVNDVIKRLEDYLFDNGVKVQIGSQGEAIIQELVFQYGVELTKMYDANGKLDIANQGLHEQLQEASDALQPFAQFAGITARQGENVTISISIDALRNARNLLGGGVSRPQ